jgi:hypothetical protein
LTADAMTESIERTEREGFTGHLSKPILRQDLLDALRRYTDGTRVTRGVAPGDAIEAQAASSKDMATGRTVSVDDDLYALIPQYLGNRRKDLQAMTDALSKGDYEIIWALGHNMKGTGMSYGMNDLTAIGDALALAAKAEDRDTIHDRLEALRVYLDTLVVVRGIPDAVRGSARP